MKAMHTSQLLMDDNVMTKVGKYSKQVPLLLQEGFKKKTVRLTCQPQAAGQCFSKWLPSIAPEIQHSPNFQHIFPDVICHSRD